MNKKICIITTVHPVFDSRIFHKQAKTLVKAGYDVVLIAQHDKKETVEGIQIVPLPKPKNRLQRIFSLTYKAMRLALKQKAVIFHFHDPELLPVGLILKLVTRKKVIYDVHEDYPQSIRAKYWVSKYVRSLISIIIDKIEKFVSNSVDTTITVTDAIESRFKKEKTIQIRNYPLLDMINLESRKSFSENYVKLIYVGGLSKDRGIIEVVKSLELIDASIKVEMVLLGKFFELDTEKMVKKLDGFKKVKYKGWVSRNKVYEELHTSDIGIVCLHSNDRYEFSLPVKLFEYMSAGLPVIASNFAVWSQIIKENECGIMVDPLNPDEIARAIEYLAKNPELRRKMGENAKKAVIEKYNWEEESKKLISLYDKLCRDI